MYMWDACTYIELQKLCIKFGALHANLQLAAAERNVQPSSGCELPLSCVARILCFNDLVCGHCFGSFHSATPNCHSNFCSSLKRDKRQV